MPIYEYLCEKCQHEFEKEQRISDPPVKTCPVCRSRKVKKLISRTSFVLKGGGWYSDRCWSVPRTRRTRGFSKAVNRRRKRPTSSRSFNLSFSESESRSVLWTRVVQRVRCNGQPVSQRHGQSFFFCRHLQRIVCAGNVRSAIRRSACLGGHQVRFAVWNAKNQHAVMEQGQHHGNQRAFLAAV